MIAVAWDFARPDAESVVVERRDDDTSLILNPLYRQRGAGPSRIAPPECRGAERSARKILRPEPFGRQPDSPDARGGT